MKNSEEKRSKSTAPPSPPALLNWRPGSYAVAHRAEKGEAYVAPNLVRIDAGVNPPMSPEDWAVVSKDKMIVRTMSGDEPILQRFEPSEIGQREVDDVLKNCANRLGVEYWRKKETRPPVIAKLDAWIEHRLSREAILSRKTTSSAAGA